MFLKSGYRPKVRNNEISVALSAALAEARCKQEETGWEIWSSFTRNPKVFFNFPPVWDDIGSLMLSVQPVLCYPPVFDPPLGRIVIVIIHRVT